jgi:hypothetical protein
MNAYGSDFSSEDAALSGKYHYLGETLKALA